MGENTFHPYMQGIRSAALFLENSFEHNQSFPVVSKIPKRTSFGTHAKVIQDLTGEDYNSYSYSKDLTPSSLNASRSSNASSFFEAEEQSNCSKEKKKALLTVCTTSAKILTANKTASELFGYTSAEFIGLKFSSLFGEVDNSVDENNLLQDICSIKGTIGNTSGEIVDVLHKKGFVMPVVIWARRVETVGSHCCIVVVEPVERISCVFEFNDEGIITSCDDKFLTFHGFQQADLVGRSLLKLMPSYTLPTEASVPKEVRLQWTTSTTNDGLIFPVTVCISLHERGPSRTADAVLYKAKMWIFPNVSGLLTCKPGGEIQSVNNNFALSLFGYSAAEISNKNITDLLPTLADNAGNGHLYNSAVPHIEIDSCLNFSYNEPENLKEKGPAPDASESWIELSIQENQSGENASDKLDRSGKAADVSQHSDFLDKVNALLNKCAAPSDRGLLCEPGTEDKSAEGGDATSDSAIHSICSGCKFENKGGGKASAQSSFSDYHSGDGCNSPVNREYPKSEHSLISSNLSREESTYSNLSTHDQSSFVVITEESGPTGAASDDVDGSDQLVKTDVENVRPNATEKRLGELKKNSILQRLSGSEVTSTPVECGRTASRIRGKKSALSSLKDGFYKGMYRHKNGSVIDAWYDVKRVHHASDDFVWCFRVYVQLSLAEACSMEAVNCTLSTSVSSLPSLSTSRSSLLDVVSADGSHDEGTKFDAADERRAVAGEFSEKYSILKSVGSGAFGFVKVAQSKAVPKQFVVKFIKKDKVLEECWIKDDDSDNLVPMEVSLLSKFNHPHIVRVFEYFENEHFFSMVMPKHGQNGLDLFEFIDRCNNIDEALCSYIFRQVVSAVDYLHAHNTLHRDIKDENIIIDENFYCKLIDFGSATFMKAGRDFATFCGTVEYCSPEVLLGNKYRGPELEMWALGVTLYTLVFGENPFKNVEETLKCEPCPPYVISEDLAGVLQWLLQPDPEFRCTMHELLECPWLNQPVDVSEYRWNDVVCTPAGSLNSSIIQLDASRGEEKPVSLHGGDVPNEENLCDKLQKLAVSHNLRDKQSRGILKPITNVASDLNNTI